ncbi:MAG: hypothetical protein WAL98_00710 [Desulfatiglandaceae bacterium]
MPLAFESLSHGAIAFGFFNIESDMLLLEHYFFFATDFCEHIRAMAAMEGGAILERTIPVIHIPSREDIGDLMGAIHGVRFSGFIGAVYSKFPFPEKEADFKQNPEGVETQDQVRELIKYYGEPKEIRLVLDSERKEARFGEYRFAAGWFQQLIAYVWQGGYPRWRDDRPPEYVVRMRAELKAGATGLFGGFGFS